MGGRKSVVIKKNLSVNDNLKGKRAKKDKEELHCIYNKRRREEKRRVLEKEE
jgi:hypothetical protein